MPTLCWAAYSPSRTMVRWLSSTVTAERASADCMRGSPPLGAAGFGLAGYQPGPAGWQPEGDWPFAMAQNNRRHRCRASRKCLAGTSRWPAPVQLTLSFCSTSGPHNGTHQWWHAAPGVTGLAGAGSLQHTGRWFRECGSVDRGVCDSSGIRSEIYCMVLSHQCPIQRSVMNSRASSAWLCRG